MARKKLVAQRLAEAMGRRGLSQTDVAESLGANQSSVSEWVRGRSSPRGDRIGDLARTLSVSADWLTGEDIPVQQPDLGLQRAREAATDIGRLAGQLSQDAELLADLEPELGQRVASFLVYIREMLEQQLAMVARLQREVAAPPPIKLQSPAPTARSLPQLRLVPPTGPRKKGLLEVSSMPLEAHSSVGLEQVESKGPALARPKINDHAHVFVLGRCVSCRISLLTL